MYSIRYAEKSLSSSRLNSRTTADEIIFFHFVRCCCRLFILFSAPTGESIHPIDSMWSRMRIQILFEEPVLWFFRSFDRSWLSLSSLAFFTTVHTQFKYSCHNHKLINAIRLFILFDSPYRYLSLSLFVEHTSCASVKTAAENEKKKRKIRFAMKKCTERHSNHKLFLLRSVHLLITLGETLVCRSQDERNTLITSVCCTRIGSIVDMMARRKYYYRSVCLCTPTRRDRPTKPADNLMPFSVTCNEKSGTIIVRFMCSASGPRSMCVAGATKKRCLESSTRAPTNNKKMRPEKCAYASTFGYENDEWNDDLFDASVWK